MSADRPIIAVLMTLDSKFDVAETFCRHLSDAGGEPWVVDLSLRGHSYKLSGVQTTAPLDHDSPEFTGLKNVSRADASQLMLESAQNCVRDKIESGTVTGIIGIGGANGSTMSCGVMRSLPPLLPKIMVTPVAATAAVQWYVAQSDIAMYPTIGDISLNRITEAILRNAAQAITAMSRSAGSSEDAPESHPPLIGVSSFGNVQVTVDRITEALEKEKQEVIHFHASGPGGKALESLTLAGELQGIIDLVTSELTDLVTGGVYSAGPDRLKSAALLGIPQIIVPGCLDFSNWWVGEVPDRYRDREFYQYNQEILLMRSNTQEFETLARMFIDNLSKSTGPFKILIPNKGFSQMTNFPTQSWTGETRGQWLQPETDAVFLETLYQGLERDLIVELDLHINDSEFAEFAVAELRSLMR